MVSVPYLTYLTTLMGTGTDSYIRWDANITFSRHTWIYPMRQKSEVFGHFQKFKNEVEKATGRHVRCLQSDGGKEYFSDDLLHTSERKEFGENSLANTLSNKTV